MTEVLRGSLTVVLSLVSLFSANPGAAQDLGVVPDAPTCGECQILLDSLLTLDGRRSPHVGEPIAFARTKDGKVLVTPAFDMDLIAVFDASGRFLQQLGREGEGPGEFKGVGQIKVQDDGTIRVYDHWNPRVSTFSPELEFVGSRPMEVPVGMGTNGLLELPRDRLLTQRSIPLAAHAGYPVHLLDPDGRILRSLGSENPSYRRGQERLMWRTLAHGPDGRVWIASTMRYEIELWDLEGEKLGELVRDVPWFPPHPDKGVSIDYRNPTARPSPGIIGLRTDSRGLIWVLLRVPDENWREGLGPVRGINDSVIGITDSQRYSDAVIELIDPKRGELLASARFDAALEMLTEDGLVLAYTEDPEGFPFVHVWRLSLKGYQGR